MPEYLVKRDRYWHSQRRVPVEYAAFDRRSIVRQWTKIRIADGRTGKRTLSLATTIPSRVDLITAWVSGTIFSPLIAVATLGVWSRNEVGWVFRSPPSRSD